MSETYPTRPDYRVHYADGSSLEVSMAPGVSLDEARRHFARVHSGAKMKRVIAVTKLDADGPWFIGCSGKFYELFRWRHKRNWLCLERGQVTYESRRVAKHESDRLNKRLVQS